METARKKMSIGEINALLISGLTQREVAQRFGVSEQAVSNMRRRNWSMAYKTPREIAMDEAWPWKVRKDQTRARTYKSCRDHLEYRSTNGVGMSEDKLKRLRGFYNKLIELNLVVEYDPSIPPIDNISGTFGGWALRPRLASDGDLIIRVNEHTEMTEEAWLMWRFPPSLP